MKVKACSGRLLFSKNLLKQHLTREEGWTTTKPVNGSVTPHVAFWCRVLLVSLRQNVSSLIDELTAEGSSSVTFCKKTLHQTLELVVFGRKFVQK